MYIFFFSASHLQEWQAHPDFWSSFKPTECHSWAKHLTNKAYSNLSIFDDIYVFHSFKFISKIIQAMSRLLSISHHTWIILIWWKSRWISWREGKGGIGNIMHFIVTKKKINLNWQLWKKHWSDFYVADLQLKIESF